MFIRGQGDTEDVLIISTEHHDEKAEGHQHHFGVVCVHAGQGPHCAYLFQVKVAGC